MTTTESLTGKSLNKCFRGRTAVQSDLVELHGGEVVGLLGPNGAGKTTTFNMMLGLVRPDSGRIELNGQDITDLPIHRRARLGIGYLPQAPSVFVRLTVSDNLAIALEAAGAKKKDVAARVSKMLAEQGLEELAHREAGVLSGGERRRVEIARALLLEPRFLLFDEPFAGIDPIAVQGVKDELRRLRNRGIGILITDHNVRETLDLCDRAYILYSGRILAQGAPKELIANPETRRVFLGDDFKL